MIKPLHFALIGFSASFAITNTTLAEELNSPINPYELYPSNVAENGMVVAQEKIAAEVGRDILARGGNAIDAAVATSFALAVTHPQAGNIGGGGFMVAYLENESRAIAIDFRETAPAAATRDMFLDDNKNPNSTLSQSHALASGVPGSVLGMTYALEEYGTMSLREVIAPAIELAEKGIPVSYGYELALHDERDALKVDPSSVTYFLEKPDGSPYAKGDIFKQQDLARTLKRISKKGAKGFYEGPVAEAIVDEITRGGGNMTLEDLKNYRIEVREPTTGSYKDFDIISMPPPSSGGIHIVQILNILEGYGDLGKLGHNSAQYLHYLIEAMRRAYADRSEYVGDPAFYDVPEELTSKEYAAALRADIAPKSASASKDIKPGLDTFYESPQTTHYSVMDQFGNAVAVTTTLNFSFGSGYSVDGAGFLLNNEMDDFSAKPGAPNGYGLIGGTANQIEPGKRPTSSMSPTIVLKDGRPFLVTGSRGGSTIITSVLQVVLNAIEFGMNAEEANLAPRIHHQWAPDMVYLETGISQDTINILENYGHNLTVLGSDLQMGFIRGSLGRNETIMYRDEYYYGSDDPRGSRGASAGY